MHLLVLSDIHANAHALRAVLHAAPSHEASLCLGDIVGYGGQPNECCELLREHGTFCLSGNHDVMALSDSVSEQMNALATASSEWTHTVLTPENQAFLQSLSPHHIFEEWKLEAVHASLAAPLVEYIQGIHSARPTWSLMRFGVCFFGHTHRAATLAELNVPGRRYQTEVLSWKEDGRTLARGDGWKTLINPGSVGQPRDGNPRARFALFDTESREIEFFAVAYDVDAARLSIIEAGLPLKFADRLALGR